MTATTSLVPPCSTYPSVHASVHTPSMIPAALARSTYPSMPPVRISIVPRPPVRPTLPPGVRAARMMGTVRKVAASLARRLPRHIDVDDLVGAGSLGLADAFSRRGAMPGSEFEAFAAFRIRGAMLDELRRLDAMPRRSRKSAKLVAIAQRAVEQKFGRRPLEEEVAGELGLDLEAYHALRARIDAGSAPIPLSATGPDAESAIDEPIDRAAEGPDSLAARAQIGERISAGIHRLPARQQTVLRGVYLEERTLKEIGVALGVTESRVCQIHSEAIAALRSTLTGEDEAPASATRARAAKRTGAQVASRASRI